MVFISFPLLINFASLAQLVEQLIRNEQVGGSSPPKGSLEIFNFQLLCPIAVQSCVPNRTAN